jgi:endonuclease YncB( thermonuclease family)
LSRKVAVVADGDTFAMESETGKVRVRICGINAPECGEPG